ncbi:surface lipoprotein assembly modifier [Magnetococcales bacterium HHB-1]
MRTLFYMVLLILLPMKVSWGEVLANRVNVIIQGQQLLSQGQAEKALSWLLKHEEEWLGDPEFDYLMGWALFDTQQLDKALFALERVLMIQPGHAMARLTTARILIGNQQWEAAEEHLQMLVQEHPQPQIRKWVDQLNQVIIRKKEQVEKGEKASAKTRLTGYLKSSIGYDTNVISGPDVSSLILPAYSYTSLYDLGDSSADEDWLATISAGFQITHRIMDKTWLTGGLSLSQSLHQSRPDVDKGIVTGEMGLSRQLNDNDLVSIGIEGQLYTLDDKRYRTYESGKLAWRHRFEKGNLLSTHLQHYNYNYFENGDEDTESTVLGVTHLWGYGVKEQPWAFYYGIQVGLEDNSTEGNAHLGNTLVGVSLGGRYRLTPTVMLNGGIGWERRQYDTEETLYYQQREDDLRQVSVSLKHQFWEQWIWGPVITHTRNESNLALYDYEQTNVSLFLQWNFDHE